MSKCRLPISHELLVLLQQLSYVLVKRVCALPYALHLLKSLAEIDRLLRVMISNVDTIDLKDRFFSVYAGSRHMQVGDAILPIAHDRQAFTPSTLVTVRSRQEQ